MCSGARVVRAVLRVADHVSYIVRIHARVPDGMHMIRSYRDPNRVCPQITTACV